MRIHLYDYLRPCSWVVQEDLSGAQVVRMTLREESAESDTSRGPSAQHGQMESSSASEDAESGWTGDGSLPEGMYKEVCLPEANYLLIEFDAAECELDARVSLVVRLWTPPRWLRCAGIRILALCRTCPTTSGFVVNAIVKALHA